METFLRIFTWSEGQKSKQKNKFGKADTFSFIFESWQLSIGYLELDPEFTEEYVKLPRLTELFHSLRHRWQKRVPQPFRQHLNATTDRAVLFIRENLPNMRPTVDQANSFSSHYSEHQPKHVQVTCQKMSSHYKIFFKKSSFSYTEIRPYKILVIPVVSLWMGWGGASEIQARLECVNLLPLPLMFWKYRYMPLKHRGCSWLSRTWSLTPINIMSHYSFQIYYLRTRHDKIVF